eukprot:TRINITY_DN17082_c0_g1_i1.p1 TRINITY_DN17082_c0_g1~~TRINITY_DN17082_c0_g1_i1.p1  ORF type:complete len:156 (+),score=27.91 TRINITY_DN17082_c0_g1_i1:82-549(+)
MTEASTDELVGPARKVFIKQLRDLEGTKWKTEIDTFTGKECIVPMIGGACSAGAEAVRVWIQGRVVSINSERATLSDNTATIEFLINEIEPEQLPKPNAYCQVVGKLAATQPPSANLTVLTELCAEVHPVPNVPDPDKAWTLEVLDYQAKYIFTS